MLINDPRSDSKIDVTGWDLDYLADQVTNVRQDRLLGVDRELTDEETDALGLTYYDTLLPLVWHTAHKTVGEHADRFGEIYDEAIYQRDIGPAIAAIHAGTPLTTPQQAAYDKFAREIQTEIPF